MLNSEHTSILQKNTTNPGKYDERDTMFSRYEIKPGTEKFNDYYNKNPDKKILDDEFRKYPGLLSPHASKADPVLFASTEASFTACEMFEPMVDGPVAKKTNSLSMNDLSQYINNWALKLGAHSAGITLLQKHHIYSTGGRGDRYGVPIDLPHTHAIAFTVEMNHDFVNQAPLAPALMESSQQYMNSASIAVQIAFFLRELGYSSRAHINKNYQVICPIIAKDCGLGEIGRMGLLMTPHLGPRVRIGVVTTEAPLIIDNAAEDSTVIDFCNRCKKCADVCPSKAISKDDRKTDAVALRWTINHEKCFKYWCKEGTDCARCMSVCPYSHPNTPFHNLVRYFVKKSPGFRKWAIPFDDIFYGKKPKIKPLMNWQKVQKV